MVWRFFSKGCCGEAEGLSTKIPEGELGKLGNVVEQTLAPEEIGNVVEQTLAPEENRDVNAGVQAPEEKQIVVKKEQGIDSPMGTRTTGTAAPLAAADTPETPLETAQKLLAKQFASSDGMGAQQMLIPLLLSTLGGATTKAKEDAATKAKEDAATKAKDDAATEHKREEDAATKAKEEAAAKAKAALKVAKNKEELLFTECNFGGKKLDGMIRHAESIVKQSKEPSNAWYWARDERARLSTAVGQVQAVVDQSQECIQTSTLSALTLKCGGAERVNVFLGSHKQSLNAASLVLSRPLEEIVSMHKVRLKSQADSLIKNKGVKKPTATPKGKPEG